MSKRRRAEQAAAEGRRRRGRFVLGGTLLAAGVLAVGVVFLAKNQAQESPIPPEALPASNAGQGELAERASDFTVETVDGETFALAAQRGKVVVIDFLAPG